MPVRVTVEACNEDHLPHRDHHYREDTFGTNVMNYWNDGAARLSGREPESEQPHEVIVAPGECRTETYTWDQRHEVGRDTGERASGVFRVHVLWLGSADDANRPEAWSPWFELTDSPDGRPPPDDYREDPTFTLQVSTDRSSYAAGDDVVATVTACNTTDREQDHGYADYGDGVPPVTVDFVHHRDDGEAHPSATRGRGPPPHEGENGSYPTATMTFAPHQCRTWTFVWNQAWEHPPPDEEPGQLAPRGRYDAYATWDGDTWDGQPAGYHPEDRAPFELR